MCIRQVQFCYENNKGFFLGIYRKIIKISFHGFQSKLQLVVGTHIKF